MAKIVKSRDGTPLLELTFDEAWDLRNAMCWAIDKWTANAVYWETRAADAGDDEVLLDGTKFSRKKEAEDDRRLVEKYEKLKDVLREYLESNPPSGRGG